jgi:hypothetical protein
MQTEPSKKVFDSAEYLDYTTRINRLLTYYFPVH